MGSLTSRLRYFIFGPSLRRIVMIGHDNSGKTTILYRMKLGEVVATTPTIGFNLETVSFGNLSLVVWDIGGSQSIQTLWKHYFSETDAVIFVVDSSDDNKFQRIADDLYFTMRRVELKDAKILILANKQDLQNAVPVAKIAGVLRLHDLDQQWFIHPCCAFTGDGLEDAFNWLHSNLL